MKILLIGEFSSLHKYLKDGLIQLGHKVVLASTGDGWKKIKGGDIPLYRHSENKSLNKIESVVSPYQIFKKLEGFDVVQLISPLIFSSITNYDLIKRIKNNNGILSLCAAGEDYASVCAYNSGILQPFVYDLDKDGLLRYNCRSFRSKVRVHSDQRVVELADVIIPSLYEYAVGYKNNRKLYDVIPFPINLDGLEYRENKVKDKVVIFHGLNREKSKGTPIIKKALEKVKQRYPNDVEIVIDGKMPFNDYINILKKSNLVIDQCLCYGYGINSCIAMAQGKVVLVSNKLENQKVIPSTHNPMISIDANPDDIYEKIVELISNKSQIQDIGCKSRAYVEEVHDCKLIAQKYIEAWKNVGSNK